MNLTTYHSQIAKLEKELLDLDKKILAEHKKIVDKQANINSVNRSITKNTSVSTAKSKQGQILRYSKEIINIQQRVNEYEKQKRTKKESLKKKMDALRKEEVALQKRQQVLGRIQNSSLNFGRTLQLTSSLKGGEEPQINFMEETNKDTANSSETNRVFISYSWDSKEHEDKVFDFSNYLRHKGFEADIDKKLGQQQTAINFLKMMHIAMHDYPKVIVVLSEGYKEKADGFKGGVGAEYELMLNDINDNPNKYILATFSGRANEIIPAGFKGRDIVDLSDSEEMTRLFEKLMGHERYVFAEVAKTKPVLPIRLTRAFFVEEAIEAPDVISIDPMIKATGDASFIAKQYKHIDFMLKFVFTNTTSSTITGFSYSVKIPRELDLDHYHEADPDGFVNYERSFAGKMFKQQKVSTEGFLIKVAHQNIRKIIGSVIRVDVYTEHGPVDKEFRAIELICIKPGGEHHLEAVPLSPDLFVS